MGLYRNIEVVGKTNSGKPVVRCFNREDKVRYAAGHLTKEGVVAVRENTMMYRRLCEVKEGRIVTGSRTRDGGISTNEDE